MSSGEGGQFVSHVLQWNTNAPDFSASSNSFWLNVTVWLWSFGQTISKSIRSLMSLPLTGQSAACACSNSFVYPDGSACALPGDPTAILSIRRSRSIMRLVNALLFLVYTKAGVRHGEAPPPAERSKHNGPARRRVAVPGVSRIRWVTLAGPRNGCMNRV